MALTVRMSPETERALNRLAKRRKLSKSDVVREALARYEQSDSERPPEGPYDDWADVLGIVDLGVRDDGRTTGDQFAELLRKDQPRRAR
ncbi:MAG: ribbon-helix-helix protein, CopG family [Acidobacteria bacterium]|nr:ribbon-helix-helix protein, CopG family [Acidobacteriota bacterium]